MNRTDHHDQLKVFAGALGAVVLCAATGPIIASPTDEGEVTQIFARMEDETGAPVFDILETTAETLFATEGLGGPLVNVEFIARPLAAELPGRTQSMDVIGVQHADPEDITTVLTSTVLPWADRARATFAMQDLYAFDELVIRHRIEGGSRTELMRLAAPLSAGSGAAGTVAQAVEICTLEPSDVGEDADVCPGVGTFPNGSSVTHSVANDPDPEQGEVSSVHIIVNNVGTWTTSENCKSSGDCGD